ncbi:unnamed protein product [Camellia sinensis]
MEWNGNGQRTGSRSAAFGTVLKRMNWRILGKPLGRRFNQSTKGTGIGSVDSATYQISELGQTHEIMQF